MNTAADFLYSRIRLVSRIAIAGAIALSLVFRNLISTSNISWQLLLAFVALAIGIPHGAVDHLISIPRNSLKQFISFIVIYVAIAIAALLFILYFNLIGFEIVIWMSAFHFGIGDLTYICENDRLAGKPQMQRVLQFFYLCSAGALPVIIPLVQPKSRSALEGINPDLIQWAGAHADQLKASVLLIAGISVVLLIFFKRLNEVFDLVLLASLSLIAPPLVAFAFYFGCWHALRHTARLTMLLPESESALKSGDWKRALKLVVLPGLPSLFGAVLISGFIFLLRDSTNKDSILWFLLALVWALTVPHMMATFRFDLKSLRTQN